MFQKTTDHEQLSKRGWDFFVVDQKTNYTPNKVIIVEGKVNDEMS